jgi:hypothetical protein
MVCNGWLLLLISAFFDTKGGGMYQLQVWWSCGYGGPGLASSEEEARFEAPS